MMNSLQLWKRNGKLTFMNTSVQKPFTFPVLQWSHLYPCTSPNSSFPFCTSTCKENRHKWTHKIRYEGCFKNSSNKQKLPRDQKLQYKLVLRCCKSLLLRLGWAPCTFLFLLLPSLETSASDWDFSACIPSSKTPASDGAVDIPNSFDFLLEDATLSCYTKSK